MIRESTIEVLNDTSLFDSRQLLPRSVLGFAMKMWVQWAKDHLRPFPSLIRDFDFGVVVLRQSIRYERPFDFFRADGFTVRSRLTVRQKRHLLFGEVEFMNGDERFASLDCAMRPLAIDSEGDLGAISARVDGAVLAMFRAEEIVPAMVERPLRKALSSMAATEARAIASAKYPIRIGRHDCEAADQWSYIEVGANASRAREALILGAPAALRQDLQAGLSQPIKAMEIEIDRPLFLFDEAEIHSSAYRTVDSLVFVHVYRSNVGGSYEQATVLECFERPV